MSETLQGSLGLIVAIAALVVSVVWVLFPFFVIRRLSAMAKHLAAIEKTAEESALVQRNFFAAARERMNTDSNVRR